MKGVSHTGKILTAAAVAAAPTAALAHTGPSGGLESGLLHPIGGLDHLLALLAMGLWAGTSGRYAGAKIAVALAAMAAGALLAMGGVTLPLVEYGLLASLLILGLIIASGAKLPQLGMPLVAAFALLHGHAHGTEIPPGASGITFMAGFLTTSAAIQVLGVCVGSTLRGGPWLVRGSGALVAFGGLVLALVR